MGRTKYSYDYPEVHPPQSQPQYPAESQATNNVSHNRFSWMEAPAEERVVQSTQAAQRQSTIPPLPTVPDHLNHDFQRQQHLAQDLPPLQMQPFTQAQPQQQTTTNPYVYVSQSQQFQQQQYQYYQQQQQQQQQQQRSHMATQLEYSNPHAQQQQYQQPQQPQWQPHQQQQAESNDQHTEQSRKPDPVKERPDHPHYRTTIAPDSNPLTPTSPQSPTSRRAIVRPQNTNMSVVPPTPSRYDFATYAPAPQSTTGGEWTHGLCSCSEPSVCMTALFCPCLLYGRAQYRLRMRSDKKDPTNMLGYKAVNGSCIGWSLLCGINGILTGIQKTRIRRSYEMAEESGSVFSDCLEGCYCCCCVLARNEKEIKHREHDGRGAANEQGYLPPVGMTFSPPPR